MPRLWVKGGGRKSRSGLFQGFGLEAQTALAGRLLFPVLAYPCLPTFSGGGIAAREGECRDIGIRNLLSLIGILGKYAHKGIREHGTGNSVKNVAFDFLAIFRG